jgi:hypothetical protein
MTVQSVKHRIHNYMRTMNNVQEAFFMLHYYHKRCSAVNDMMYLLPYFTAMNMSGNLPISDVCVVSSIL